MSTPNENQIEKFVGGGGDFEITEPTEITNDPAIRELRLLGKDEETTRNKIAELEIEISRLSEELSILERNRND